jgi:hypothetical protein
MSWSFLQPLLKGNEHSDDGQKGPAAKPQRCLRSMPVFHWQEKNSNTLVEPIRLNSNCICRLIAMEFGSFED